MRELEKAAECQKELAQIILEDCDETLTKAVSEGIKTAYIAGANYAIKNAWQRADGDYLPEIDREVIALQKCASGHKVVYAHRPNPNGYVILKGKKLYPKCYDKGGWNMEGVEYWLDLELPKDGKDNEES